MPIYDYECTSCNLRLEVRHSMNTQTPNCPQCESALTKLILSAPAVHGHMTAGREQAIRALQPGQESGTHQHGPGCGCDH
ncbi:MAG: zinc ribbon domain-containing protein [Nitrosomonas sp.]|nr:zinc ribbon domain-containing protein [Nitrosomonas sp.]